MRFLSWSGSPLLRSRSSTPRAASISEELPMIFDYALGGLVTLAITVYLIFALINPERF